MADGSTTEWIPAPTSDQDWDPDRDALFYRRLPLVLDSVLRARMLTAVTSSIVHGGEYLWPGAELRLDGVDAAELPVPGLIEAPPSHILKHGASTDLRRRTSVRRIDVGIEVAVSLTAHGASLGELVLVQTGPDAWVGRQEREHLRAYAEMCSTALHSCLALAELRRLALTDALTGLANRRALDHELDRVDADGRRTAVLFVDVDGLREANNTLGYDAGDRLICALAAALREAIDAADFAGREGGDEFVVILRDPGRAREVGKRVQAAFSRQPLPPDVAACSHGASVGVAVGREGEAARDVVRRAAQRMRSEKRRRKARIAPNAAHP